MIQIWIDLIKKANGNLSLLNRQELDHYNWISRIMNSWSRQELSKVEHHVFDKFYLLPPLRITKTISSGCTAKPAGNIISIPTGTYDITQHYGYGNFCISNGILYSTVGTDVYSMNLSTEAITRVEDVNIGRYFMSVHWNEFPPKLGTEFQWKNVKKTMKIHTMYPMEGGRFVTFTPGIHYDSETLNDTPGILRVHNSAFSVELNVPVATIRPFQIAIIGNLAYLFYKDTAIKEYYKGNVRKTSHSYITINLTTGLQESTGKLYTGMYSGGAGYTIFENHTGRLSTRGPFRVYFNNLEEYEEWNTNKPDTFYKRYDGNSGPSYEASSGKYYIYAKFYAFELFVAGEKKPEIWSASSYYPGSQLATLGTSIVSFDPKARVIRILKTTGEIERIISFSWCDHFLDEQAQFTLDTENTQISVDPCNQDYIYVLFNGYHGTAPGRLLGRLKIVSD